MKMWDGRFSASPDKLLEQFGNSLPFDQELVEEDIAGSIAWARALGKAGVISAQDAGKIATGLETILERHHRESLQFDPDDEDIHMAVERLLVEQIGATGANLHTGRSRNDQVATDLRLHTRKRLRSIAELVKGFQKALLERAEKEKATVVPGYTHLQRAQPVTLAHYWLSFLFLLERERERVEKAIQTTDVLPLGAGALAGSGFAVDRDYLAEQLGFSRVSENSMDAVASRDFVLEALGSLSSLGISLSRYAEDLIIWSSQEFGFVELADQWATGSSMMPQKKNPDVLELMRGKAGRLIGNYTRFAATLKGVGLTYYKDLQEDKETLFDSLMQVELMLAVFPRVVASLSVNADRTRSALDPSIWATDVADYLVEKGVAFREAHRIVGMVVRHCLDSGVPLNELDLSTLKTFSDAFDSDLHSVFSWDQALVHRDVRGGTGPQSVEGQLAAARGLVG